MAFGILAGLAATAISAGVRGAQAARRKRQQEEARRQAYSDYSKNYARMQQEGAKAARDTAMHQMMSSARSGGSAGSQASAVMAAQQRAPVAGAVTEAASHEIGRNYAGGMGGQLGNESANTMNFGNYQDIPVTAGLSLMSQSGFLGEGLNAAAAEGRENQPQAGPAKKPMPMRQAEPMNPMVPTVGPAPKSSWSSDMTPGIDPSMMDDSEFEIESDAQYKEDIKVMSPAQALDGKRRRAGAQNDPGTARYVYKSDPNFNWEKESRNFNQAGLQAAASGYNPSVASRMAASRVTRPTRGDDRGMFAESPYRPRPIQRPVGAEVPHSQVRPNNVQRPSTYAGGQGYYEIQADGPMLKSGQRLPVVDFSRQAPGAPQGPQGAIADWVASDPSQGLSEDQWLEHSQEYDKANAGRVHQPTSMQEAADLRRELVYGMKPMDYAADFDRRVDHAMAVQKIQDQWDQELAKGKQVRSRPRPVVSPEAAVEDEQRMVESETQAATAQAAAEATAQELADANAAYDAVFNPYKENFTKMEVDAGEERQMTRGLMERLHPSPPDDATPEQLRELSVEYKRAKKNRKTKEERKSKKTRELMDGQYIMPKDAGNKVGNYDAVQQLIQAQLAKRGY